MPVVKCPLLEKCTDISRGGNRYQSGAPHIRTWPRGNEYECNYRACAGPRLVPSRSTSKQCPVRIGKPGNLRRSASCPNSQRIGTIRAPACPWHPWPPPVAFSSRLRVFVVHVSPPFALPPQIAKRTQFLSKPIDLHTLTTKIFLFCPKANLMILVPGCQNVADCCRSVATNVAI